MSQIFSSLPPSVDTLCSVSDMQMVKQIFTERPSIWLTSDEVERLAGWRKQRTGEKVRKVVNELVEIGVPIVHGQGGFMLTMDVIDVMKADEDLARRQQGIARKREAYARIAQRLSQQQTVMAQWVL